MTLEERLREFLARSTPAEREVDLEAISGLQTSGPGDEDEEEDEDTDEEA